MFEFLHDIYQDKSLTLSQLQEAVLIHNAKVSNKDKIRAADLSKGEYINLHKYLNKIRKLNTMEEELRQKKIKCMEMRIRILILEQRLKAYEYFIAHDETPFQG